MQDKRGNLAVAVARVLRQAKEPVPEFQELPSDSSSMPANLEWAPATAVIKAQRFAGCPACVSFGGPKRLTRLTPFVDSCGYGYHDSASSITKPLNMQDQRPKYSAFNMPDFFNML